MAVFYSENFNRFDVVEAYYDEYDGVIDPYTYDGQVVDKDFSYLIGRDGQYLPFDRLVLIDFVKHVYHEDLTVDNFTEFFDFVMFTAIKFTNQFDSEYIWFRRELTNVDIQNALQ